ncbi:DHA2 family efflux MFS transporter permease subunit [Senegalimassilia faecalis]|uniref:DHA2 family efflux MFS transporter permease subunit n=1 Tax=Senegalimassilia faecalis TaxID=2509433 RepID=A0A4Q2JY15_9ACTN|nr:MDR family MFS transporter [Senegalimassilia faecalis]RXZ53955.1 DHA2 family efflux MFS transporter permease subunit [Senegalimassilia faecalis]
MANWGLTRKQIVMLAVLVFGTFVTVLNQTVVSPALPSIMSEMNVDAATAQWLTTGFTLVNAIMVPITAFLTDRFTTRRLFLTSMILFTCGTALAAWGPSFPVLLGGRLVQAAGAGILMPLVMTVLMWTFPVDRRGTAMGVFGIVIAFAPAAGPTVAGIIIDQANWHVMFWIIAALCLVVIFFAGAVLERGGETNKDVTLDVPSVILSTIGFGGLLYGLSAIGSYGVTADSAAGVVIGAVALAFFFRRQLRMEQPMLQVRVLANRKFLIATIIVMLVQGALLAGGILLPILLQSYMGFSATTSGLVLLPGAIIMGAMGPVAGRLFDKHGPRVLAVTGTGILALTTSAFVFMGPGTGLVTLTAIYTVRLFSLSLVNMPISTWGMNALPDKLVNHGTSVQNTFRQVAGSLGTAIIVSTSTAVQNAVAGSTDATTAGVFGIHMAFVVATALCVIGFVLTVALVRNKPGDEAAADEDNKHRSLIEQIMKRDVYTLPEDATVLEAMQLLVNNHISAAPLVDATGKPTGFISDGDIMRYLSKRGQMIMDPVVMIVQTVDAYADHKDYAHKLEHLMSMKASDIGAKGIIGVNVHADLPEVCRVLGENHLKKVPVLDNGIIVGVINRSDITHFSMERYLADRAEAQ